MRINDDGQITIPPHLRERTGLAPGTEVEFHEESGRLYLQKTGPDRGRQLVERLRGQGTVRMTTDEIMALTRSE